jgi:hypothetical protein
VQCIHEIHNSEYTAQRMSLRQYVNALITVDSLLCCLLLSILSITLIRNLFVEVAARQHIVFI